MVHCFIPDRTFVVVVVNQNQFRNTTGMRHDLSQLQVFLSFFFFFLIYFFYLERKRD